MFNKIDRLENTVPRLDHDTQGRPQAVWLSAESGAGLPLLHTALGQSLAPDLIRRRIYLAPQQGRTRALLYEAMAVVAESPTEDGGTMVDLCIPAARLRRILDDQTWNARSANR